ncbi:biotin/lipoyl-binding protein, partial [Xanthomonas sp. Kuri4-1]
MSEQNDDPQNPSRDASAQDGRDGRQGGSQDGAQAGRPEGAEPAKPSPLKNPKVRWTLIAIGVVVAVALLIWLTYHLLVGRYLQETNNAYLQADSVAVAPRVNGYVTAVHVHDNQIVEAGQPLLQIDGRTYTATLQQAEAAVAARQADIVAAQANVTAQHAQLAQ